MIARVAREKNIPVVKPPQTPPPCNLVHLGDAPPVTIIAGCTVWTCICDEEFGEVHLSNILAARWGTANTKVVAIAEGGRGTYQMLGEDPPHYMYTRTRYILYLFVQ